MGYNFPIAINMSLFLEGINMSLFNPSFICGYKYAKKEEQYLIQTKIDSLHFKRRYMLKKIKTKGSNIGLNKFFRL
jgi:hypothetical protein